MSFLIFFSIFTILITVTELPILIIILLLLFFILFTLIKKIRFFYIALLAFALSLFSRQFYQFRNPPQSIGKLYLSTGIISDIESSGKYIFISDDKEYLLYSTKSYIPGNKIRLVARNSVISQSNNSISNLKLVSVFYTGFNSQKRSKMKGYANVLYETNSLLIDTGTISGIAKIRYLLSQKLVNTYKNNQTAGLVLGMLIGDKSKFTKSDYNLFIDSGLVHLVAVSGGNIVMLVSFLTIILFFLPFYIRISFIIVFIMFYGIICGMDSSVFRAVLTGIISIFILFLGRGVSLWRLLGLAHIIMLVYNPYFLVYDVGYLLSFSAVLGIIFTDILFTKNQSDSIQKKQSGLLSKISKLFKLVRSSYLKPSLGATLGIFPVIIFFMGKINIGGIIGNIFVLPLVPFVMIGGFITAFLPSRLQKYCIVIIDLMVSWIYTISTFIDQYGIIISTDSVLVKFIIFFIVISMMMFVILTLTREEVAKTNKDEIVNKYDTQNSIQHQYSIGDIFVEVFKKS